MIHHCISSWNLSDCYLLILRRRKYRKCDDFANASILILSTLIHVIFINNFKNDTSLYIIAKSFKLLSIYFKKKKISEMWWFCERIDINIVHFYSLLFLLIVRLKMIHHCISSWNLSDCYLFILKYRKCDDFANTSILTLSTFICVIFINNSFKNDTSLHIIFQIAMLCIYCLFEKKKISEMRWLCERIDIDIVHFYSRDFY